MMKPETSRSPPPQLQLQQLFLVGEEEGMAMEEEIRVERAQRFMAMNPR